MALATSNLTASAVKTALNESSYAWSTLCKSGKINPWSVWKPVSYASDTLTFAQLQSVNYGITMLNAATPQALLTKVQNNSNAGYTYTRPSGGASSPYRIMDFRGYDSTAINPKQSVYSGGETVKIGGVSSDWETTLAGIETACPTDLSTTTYLTPCHIYPSGYTWTRGALITDGTTTRWSVGIIPWGNTYWQSFADKSCTVFEFVTNLSSGTLSTSWTHTANDKFYALPDPIHTITVSSEAPAGSKDVWIQTTHNSLGGFKFTDTTYAKVTYNFCFSSVGDVYAGGTLSNIYIGLYRDLECKDMITQTALTSVTLGSEETSSAYTGTLQNSDKTSGVYLGIYWNNSLGYRTNILASSDGLETIT